MNRILLILVALVTITAPAVIAAEVGSAITHIQVVDGVKATVSLHPLKVEMPRRAKETHHISITLKDAVSEKDLTEGDVGVHMLGPDTREQVKELTMIQGHFDADVEMSGEGTYVVTGTFRLKDGKVRRVVFSCEMVTQNRLDEPKDRAARDSAFGTATIATHEPSMIGAERRINLSIHRQCLSIKNLRRSGGTLWYSVYNSCAFPLNVYWCEGDLCRIPAKNALIQADGRYDTWMHDRDGGQVSLGSITGCKLKNGAYDVQFDRNDWQCWSMGTAQ